MRNGEYLRQKGNKKAENFLVENFPPNLIKPWFHKATKAQYKSFLIYQPK